MSTQSKYAANWECAQDANWRARATSDEGTEVDLRWGFEPGNFREAAALEVVEPEELLLAQVSGERCERGEGALSNPRQFIRHTVEPRATTAIDFLTA